MENGDLNSSETRILLNIYELKDYFRSLVPSYFGLITAGVLSLRVATRSLKVNIKLKLAKIFFMFSFNKVE